ncbi:MAG: AAA family ATPase, partial [Syntrophobacteraceae bacterium]|nr:AAA family ATPase [Syntrophobacteraceae bacterium]
MSKSIYIAGTGPGSGKSVVVLGVMEWLARQGRKIGFFRPVVEEGAMSDHLVALVTSRYDIKAPHENVFGVDHATVRDLLLRNKEEELHSRILDKYRALEQECDLVVCAGTDYHSMHAALELEFNIEVARNLGAPLMPVVAGQGRKIGEIVGAVHVLAEFLEEKKCDVLSVIVNRVAPFDVPEAATQLQEGLPVGIPVFVLPAHPLLDKPMVCEIQRALGAEILHGELDCLDREVLHYKVASMELPNFLDHLEEGSLVIASGDRPDIIIGTLVADAATSY